MHESDVLLRDAHKIRLSAGTVTAPKGAAVKKFKMCVFKLDQKKGVFRDILYNNFMNFVVKYLAVSLP